MVEGPTRFTPRSLRELSRHDLGSQLLSAARVETPTADARARTLAAVALGGAASTVAAKVTAAQGAAAAVSGVSGQVTTSVGGSASVTGTGAALGSAGNVAAGGALGTAGSALKGAAVKSTVALVAKWAGAGVVSVAVTAAATHYVGQRDDQRAASSSSPVAAPAPAPAPPPAPVPALVPQGVSPQAEMTAKPMVQAVLEPSASPRRPRLDRAKAEPALRPTAAVSQQDPAPISASELRAEVALLDRARGALRETNYAGAHQSLQDYRRRFPSGHLSQEATFLRMQLLAAEGKTEAARDAALDIVKRYPSGPHANKAREVVKSVPSGSNRADFGSR